MKMKKLILSILLMLTISYSVDFIAAGLTMAGVEQDKFGHFIGGKLATEVLEENFTLEPFQSAFVIYLMAEAKEQIDVATGSKRDVNDITATMLGWVCQRFLQWKIEF